LGLGIPLVVWVDRFIGLVPRFTKLNLIKSHVLRFSIGGVEGVEPPMAHSQGSTLSHKEPVSRLS